MKIVFMGTPDFSVTALDALVNAGHEVICVYSQPPRPAGRGKKDRPSPVQARAETLGVPVRHPVSLKGEQAQKDFADLHADVAVVVAYGLILPQQVLTAPRFGCLNIHASLLPRWRGAAPIQRAIMAGDKQTGVTIMQMDEGLDTGPMLLRKSVEIADTQTAGDLHDHLSEIGASLIVDALKDIDNFSSEPQPNDGITYAAKIDKAEAAVNWNLPARQVADHIRGLAPFPGAYVEINGERIKLLGAKVVEGTGVAGAVSENFTVSCKSGAVQITKAQRPGKRAMDIDEFLRGFSLPTHI